MISDERSLDEALDEIDRWSEHMIRELESLSPEQRSDYFKRAKAELEKRLARPLDLPIRHAPVKEATS